jgi:gephyrin
VRVGVLTVSDRAASGAYEDRSGSLIVEVIRRRTGWQVTEQAVVADELDQIAQILRDWTLTGLTLILTTGGTGFSSRDVTPEATLQVIDREAPGIAEALRSESLKITHHAMLSRARAGIRDSTLIVNLPGSPKAVKENLDILLPVLPHALDLLSGSPNSEKGHQAI